MRNGMSVSLCIIILASGYPTSMNAQPVQPPAAHSIEQTVADLSLAPYLAGQDVSGLISALLASNESALLTMAEVDFARPNPTRDDEVRLWGVIDALSPIGKQRAAGLLVQHISWQPHSFGVMDDASSSNRVRYRCVGSLIRIGIPALPELVHLLARSEDPEVIRLARSAVRSIALAMYADATSPADSRADAMAQLYLEAEAGAQTTPDGKARLHASADFFADKTKRK